MIRREPSVIHRLPRAMREWERSEPLPDLVRPLAPPGHLDLPSCVVGGETDPIWDACVVGLSARTRLLERFPSSPLEDRALRDGATAMRLLAAAALRAVSGARLCVRLARSARRRIETRRIADREFGDACG